MVLRGRKLLDLEETHNMFWLVYKKHPQGSFKLVFQDYGSKKTQMCTQTLLSLASL